MWHLPTFKVQTVGSSMFNVYDKNWNFGQNVLMLKNVTSFSSILNLFEKVDTELWYYFVMNYYYLDEKLH